MIRAIGVSILAAWAMTATWWLIDERQLRRRAYDYAVHRSAELDLWDPAGRAYSDMATTIEVGPPERTQR